MSCAWGLYGLRALSPTVEVLIIVDVLSFSTTTSIAVARGASVYPCRWRDGRSDELAERHGAVVAARRGTPGALSLSPASMCGIDAGARVVLPSPNGSTLSLEVDDRPILAGCVRNAPEVARVALEFGDRVGIVAAGERWPDPDALRPALEDWLGAGAIVSALSTQGCERSPSAHAAAAAWTDARPVLRERLLACASGQELVQRGFAPDVALAAEHGADAVAPILCSEAYVAFAAVDLDAPHDRDRLGPR